MYNISCSSNPSYIYINSAHLCFLQAQPYIFTKVNSQSRPAIPTLTSTWSSTTSSASPYLCRRVLTSCLCGCPWFWALVAFWAFLSFLWKFSTAIDVTNTNQGKKWKWREWNSDLDDDFTVITVNLHLPEFSDPTILMNVKFINFNLCKNWYINIWWNNPE